MSTYLNNFEEAKNCYEKSIELNQENEFILILKMNKPIIALLL